MPRRRIRPCLCTSQWVLPLRAVLPSTIKRFDSDGGDAHTVNNAWQHLFQFYLGIRVQLSSTVRIYTSRSARLRFLTFRRQKENHEEQRRHGGLPTALRTCQGITAAALIAISKKMIQIPRHRHSYLYGTLCLFWSRVRPFTYDTICPFIKTLCICRNAAS